MSTETNNKIVTWIESLLFCLVLILPARCFNGFFLSLFQTNSNINVQYINLVDLAIILVTISFIIGKNKLFLDKTFFKLILFYIGSNVFMSLLLVFTGHGDFIGELISKSVIVLCAGVIVTKLDKYTETQKCAIYIIPLSILVIASFFLSGYGAYATMNRVGSLGFGTNETANFACIILAIALFVTNINIWLRVASVLISLACVLNVASRRGMLVAIAIVVIWFLLLLWNNRSSKIASRAFWGAIITIVGCIVVLIIKHEQILNYVNNSALMIRYRIAARYNNEFIDISDRISIYDEIFEYLNNHFVFGSYGCDKLLAQGHIAHSHNLLLQFIATYGVLIGPIYALFSIITFVRSLILLKHYFKVKENVFSAIISIFYTLYFVFEMFGYLLWNPKGLLWIVITMFFIRFEYRKLKNSSDKTGNRLNYD